MNRLGAAVVLALGLASANCGNLTDEQCKKPTLASHGQVDHHMGDRLVEGACLKPEYADLDDMRTKCNGSVKKVYGSYRVAWGCDTQQ